MTTHETEKHRRSLPFVPFIAGGTIEHAFAGEAESMCPARIALSKADQRPPADGGWAMARGILAGAVVESELARWVKGGGFSLDLGGVIDQQSAKHRMGLRVPADRLLDLHAEVHTLARAWQEGFPPADDGLAWDGVAFGLDPQTDLVVLRDQREPAFGLRIRPDIVVRVGDALVAVEFTTAQNPEAVSSARVALNHFALRALVHRTPRWRDTITRYGTRVELLTRRSGYTRFLGADEESEWGVGIVEAAEAHLRGDTAPRRGPWCNRCVHFAPCMLIDTDMTGDLPF